MKRLLLAFLVAFSVAAQQTLPDKTGLLYNGRFWNQLTAEMKLGYVIGFSDGVVVCDDDKLACGMSFGESRHALDKFYDSPENILIGIRVAVHFIAKKAAGMDPVAFEREIAETRRFSKTLADSAPSKNE